MRSLLAVGIVALASALRAPAPLVVAPTRRAVRTAPTMMPKFLKQVGLTKPIKRSGLRIPLNWALSSLAIPGVGLASLALTAPPPGSAELAQLQSFTAVWRRFVPFLTYKFLAVVGLAKIASVAAINGALRYKGESLERPANAVLAAICLCGGYTHFVVGEPFGHSIVLAALFLANGFYLK